MKHSIDCVPGGWWTLRDAADFYPQDLPGEWRLTYFANAFPAVLVPASAWQRSSLSELADWRAAVHLRFRFYLECPEPFADRPLARAVAAFGSAVAGFVQTSARRVPGDHSLRHELLKPGTNEPAGGVAHAPRPLNADLRAARHWLDALPEDSRLVVLDGPSAVELEHWHTLIRLLGGS